MGDALKNANTHNPSGPKPTEAKEISPLLGKDRFLSNI